eukprot:CAMPEP_0119353540 /NCGR_PEP_ID=MMETSP1334-20130426/2657_1 /TAXON_ID=127549 /ORGANISM="Calcidiscus leptoporus, Strain RCC1130" /LENGTH=38 /DNA_ID= /DNA_START= /DNA_END= /DNA_ORIENTATION=
MQATNRLSAERLAASLELASATRGVDSVYDEKIEPCQY